MVGYSVQWLYQLYESLEDIDKIRILVGLNVDKQAYETMLINEENGTIDFEPISERKTFSKNLIYEIEESGERPTVRNRCP
ncbi:MAG: hypothetical protein IPF54_26360 [Draconibacterium sp.]|nr:hypothetical protein [Draconibacterium sp.]